MPSPAKPWPPSPPFSSRSQTPLPTHNRLTCSWRPGGATAICHIAVFQTACLKETAELCALLRDQWTTDPTTFEQPTTMTYIETRGKSRQENSDDPAVFATSVLQACRGISSTGAQAILAVFKNLEGIMAATQEQFAAVQVGKQKLGQVKAARLFSLLHSPPTQ